MKENKAPEKIYLFENPITETPDDRWLSKRSGDDDIEYTRTDAFIEKASTFLCECIEDCMARYMETWSIEMKTKTIDNFKKYMKQ